MITAICQNCNHFRPSHARPRFGLCGRHKSAHEHQNVVTIGDYCHHHSLNKACGMTRLYLDIKDEDLLNATLSILKRNGIENIHPDFVDTRECSIAFAGMDELEAAQRILSRYRIGSHLGDQKIVA